MNWRTTWVGYFGPLSQERAEAWQAILAAEIPNSNEQHLQKAVEVLAATWDSERAPTLRTLKGEVRRAALRARGINVEVPFPVRRARDSIYRMAVEGLGRWNLICETVQTPEGREWGEYLERMAVKSGGLTVPYWAESALRAKGCVVMCKADFMATLPDDVRAEYAAAETGGLRELVAAKAMDYAEAK